MSDELKAQLHTAHARVFDGLLDAVAGLDAAPWGTPTGCPGWDVHDQLAHVVGVERSMLGDPADEVELPDELPHVRNDFGRAVEVAVAARRGRSPDELVEEARETFTRRLAAIDAMPAASLAEPLDGPSGMRMKASQMLRTRLFDMVSHEQDIRRALQRPGSTDGPHADIAVEQVLRAWARMLPERHGQHGVLEVVVPERDTVRIDLADGQLHRGGTGPTPTATIHLEVPGLLALAGGRTDAPEAAAVTAGGDAGWAATVLAGATITP
jgi:uncharacterized protein (TIGR03083 family)